MRASWTLSSVLVTSSDIALPRRIVDTWRERLSKKSAERLSSCLSRREMSEEEISELKSISVTQILPLDGLFLPDSSSQGY